MSDSLPAFTPPHDLGVLPIPIVYIEHPWQPPSVVPPPTDALTPPTALPPPPLNIDVPYASQTGNVVSCTMGNWSGEPTAYHYLWQRDGATDIGGAASYTVTTADTGHTLTCIVTAINAGGAVSVTSNGVVALAPTTQGETNAPTGAGDYLDSEYAEREPNAGDSG